MPQDCGGTVTVRQTRVLAYRRDGEKVRHTMIDVYELTTRIYARAPEHMKNDAISIADFLYENEKRVNAFIANSYDGGTYVFGEDDIEVFFGILVLATRPKSEYVLFWGHYIPEIRDALLFLKGKVAAYGDDVHVCRECGEAFTYEEWAFNHYFCPNYGCRVQN